MLIESPTGRVQPGVREGIHDKVVKVPNVSQRVTRRDNPLALHQASQPLAGSFPVQSLGDASDSALEFNVKGAGLNKPGRGQIVDAAQRWFDGAQVFTALQSGSGASLPVNQPLVQAEALALVPGLLLK